MAVTYGCNTTDTFKTLRKKYFQSNKREECDRTNVQFIEFRKLLVGDFLIDVDASETSIVIDTSEICA